MPSILVWRAADGMLMRRRTGSYLLVETTGSTPLGIAQAMDWARGRMDGPSFEQEFSGAGAGRGGSRLTVSVSARSDLLIREAARRGATTLSSVVDGLLVGMGGSWEPGRMRVEGPARRLTAVVSDEARRSLELACSRTGATRGAIVDSLAESLGKGESQAAF